MLFANNIKTLPPNAPNNKLETVKHKLLHYFIYIKKKNRKRKKKGVSHFECQN